MSRPPVAFVLAIGLFATSHAAIADDPAEFAFQPHPGAPLPLAAILADEEGRAVPLGRFFTGKPVVLVLEYLRCKTFCGLTLRNVVAGLDRLSLDGGRDFQLVAVDIDPRDGPADAAAAKTEYLSFYRHPEAGRGIHFLTGPEAAVRPIAEAIGFPYRYEPELDQYRHPAGFVVASADGRVSRYFLGAGGSEAELTAALAGVPGNDAPGPLRRFLLLCGADGVLSGRFTVPVLTAFSVANLLATAAMVALFAAIRRRRQR